MNEIQAQLHTALEIVPELDDPRDPSPPLSATIQHIVSVLTERKDRERSRAHELEVLRMKREEADKVRWHQVSSLSATSIRLSPVSDCDLSNSVK